MGHIERYFRLTNQAGGLGLSCTPEGLSLAGVPLLQKTDAGFGPRRSSDLNMLLKAAYGGDAGADNLAGSLQIIARDLDRGETARAMIAAVLMRLPELDWEAAVRLACADEQLAKYDPDQPRDAQGRWTDEGGTDPSEANAPDSDDDASPQSPLEQKYDNLGPVEFAEQVIQFGDRLGREGANLTPEERTAAQEEYAFLQDRLSFWLAYDYKPANAQGNLLSAELTLYEGAVISHIAAVGGPHGDLPRPMVAVAVGALGLDNSQPDNVFRRPLPGTPIVDERVVPVEGISEVGETGGIESKQDLKVKWTGGIIDQGAPLESYLAEAIPGATRLPAGAKTFDLYVEASGEAISAKTLNTVTFGYANKPQRIYGRLRRYVNAAADYSPRTRDLPLDQIRSRTIHLAIPENTSPVQWRYVDRAIRYASSRNVSMIVTRIRE